MVLLIDTAHEPARLGLARDGVLVKEVALGPRRELSHRLLDQIDRLLTAAGASIKTLSAIAVVRGPGSFTGLRLGVSVANALTASLPLPLVSVRASEAPTLAEFARAAERALEAGASESAVIPEYDKPPSITPPAA